MIKKSSDQQIIDLQQYFCRKSFTYFLNRGFYELNPGQELHFNWHLTLIAKHLEAVENGDIKRLIINIPPRHLKSLTINVLWSAWLLGQDPKARIISASYSAKLSEKHANDVRQVLNAPWYRTLFPEVEIGQNNKSKIATTQNGFRIATSIGGTLTGEGGDIIIIDDPHTPAQANSIKHRQKVLDWFDQTLMTRLNNPKFGKIVLVMQRLHDSDLTGHLINKKSKWQLLSIPVINDKDQQIKFNNFNFFRPAKSAICAEMLAIKEIEAIKTDIGSAAFTAQYLQNPIKITGQYIKSQWIQNSLLDEKSFTEIYQSWDCAFKCGKSNDFSACATVAIKDGKIHLIDILKVKLEFTDLKKAVYKQYSKYNPHAVLIEDKASGQALIQDITRTYAMPVIKIRPKLDKISRFMQSVNLFEAESIHIPQKALWYADFLNELMSFPNVLHDDQVDAFTQFLNWHQSRISHSVRSLL